MEEEKVKVTLQEIQMNIQENYIKYILKNMINN